MFSGSFLENLEWPFFMKYKIMVAEKNNFSSDAKPSFAM